MGAVPQGLTTVGRAGGCTSVYQQSLTWKLKNRDWGPSRSFHQELTEMGSKRPEPRLQRVTEVPTQETGCPQWRSRWIQEVRLETGTVVASLGHGPMAPRG